MNRAMSRLLTLTLAAGFAVVGSAGAANAWDNTISGTVECATGGGWAVTWRVVNSEPNPETITESNRPAAVPVDTTLDESETRTFTETITTKPTADVTLTLTAEWDTGDTSTDSGTVPLASFSDNCVVKTLTPPTVPVVDDCGPGNAHYGTVPSGPWTATTNPDGSLTLTATPGNVFPNGQTSITLPAPVDSLAPCPVAAPPVVVPPEVLPAEVRVVTAKARHIDKCGRTSDMYKVAKRPGVVYRAGGKVLREGRWLKATHRTVTVRAKAADATFRLTGKSVWRMSFSNRPCAQAPEIAPDTGA
jgi:hypothetical protein